MLNFFSFSRIIGLSKKSLTDSLLSGVFCLFLLFAPLSAYSEDPGVPDTVRIDVDSLIVNRSVPIDLVLINDEQLELISFGFKFLMIDSGFAKFDSVVFVNRMADPSVLNVRWVLPMGVDGVQPDSLSIVCYRVLSSAVPAGNSPIARIYMTGLSVGNMSMDSCFIPPGSNFVVIAPVNNDFIPKFVTQAIRIVEGTALPLLSTSESSLTDDANSNFGFDVNVSSPEGFPVSASIASFKNYDNSAISPTNAPSFSFNNGVYHFSWNSTGDDVGIWKAVVRACDSTDGCVSDEVVIQVVENAGYFVNLLTTESPGFSYPTALGFGNFDGDMFPEIATTGLGYMTAKMFNVYDNDGSGTFPEVFGHDDPPNHRRGLEIGYLDDDELLDIAQFIDEGSGNEKIILVFTGIGNNSFSTPITTPMPSPYSLVASMGKYNNDEYLDYIVGGLNTFRVFSGSSSLQFSLINEINTIDSILTITSADFNNDGYDDVAIGTPQGLRIYTCNGAGNFSLQATYSQIYGSVNIEVTNQGADFNGDNVFDLCIATPSVGDTSSQLVVYLGNGNGTFQQRITRDVRGQISANSPGDYNNDGLVDIAFLNSSHRYLGILFGDGDGYFTNEIRYAVPVHDPYRIISTDADLDGDVDALVVSYRIANGSSLFFFENQGNPVGFISMSVDLTGEDNAQLELVSPSNKVLNRVGSSVPSGNYYRRNINLNDKLDDFANMNLVESGDYVLTVRPDPSQPAGTPFTVEFNVDGELHRLAKNAVMSGAQYEFALNLNSGMSVAPRPGGFVHANPPGFGWPNKTNVDFQLSSDLDFYTILIDSTIASSTFQPASPLTITDTSTFYWRIKPAGSPNYSSIYAFNLVSSNSSCGDVDGIAGPINILDLTYIVDRIFRGGPPPPNFANADLNNDGAFNILDLTVIVDYIFRGGQPPVCAR